MVIADSSVLIHLARIERLDLLRHLYQHVIIPPAVYHETVEEGGSVPVLPRFVLPSRRDGSTYGK